MKTISCKEAVEFILKKEEGKLSIIQRVRPLAAFDDMQPMQSLFATKQPHKQSTEAAATKTIDFE
jgi:hypothetical protein